MENIKDKDLELMEVITEEEYVFEPEEKPRRGHIGKIIVGAGIAGATVLAIKGRNKIEKMTIKRLEKKGYEVYKPMDNVSEVVDEVVEDETAEDTKE